MHVSTSVTQAQSIGVGLENILTHRDNLALVNYERDVLLLSFHCHRKRLGNGHVIFNYSINVHSSLRQPQIRTLNGRAGRGDSLVQGVIILSLEFIKRLDGESNERKRNFNTFLCFGVHQPRHHSKLSFTNWNHDCRIFENNVSVCHFVTS